MAFSVIVLKSNVAIDLDEAVLESGIVGRDLLDAGNVNTTNVISHFEGVGFRRKSKMRKIFVRSRFIIK